MRHARRFAITGLALAASLSFACLTDLHKAKRDYAAGQEMARLSQTARAVSSWKKALEEAGRACRRNPSAQAFTVKGLAEANLGRRREAEASFLQAFSFGFGPGAAWAADSALAGLAVSFEDMGLEAPALRLYAQIADRSDFRPALMVAAERRTSLVLARLAGLEPGDRSRTLAARGKSLDRLVDRDFACGLFHYLRAQGAAGSLRQSLASARPCTHLGLGSAQVERIASNRRYLAPDGSLRFDRTSSTRNELAAAAPENLIDPWLKALSFWDGEEPVAAVSGYAVHPMSYYGQGDVSADFPGLARRRRQQDTPGVKQIYFMGCAGNVTAGKYNTGDPANRPVLAGRLYQALVNAWNETRRAPLSQADVPRRARPARATGRPSLQHGGTGAPAFARVDSISAMPRRHGTELA